MSEIVKPYKVQGTNYWTNLVDSNTGESVNFEEVTTWYDGTPMDDDKVDGVIYRKLPASVGGSYVKRSFDNGVVNVKWFGAKGDGISDDTEAVQNMLDSAPNFSNILIPPGTYKISSTINIPNKELKITGSGRLRQGRSSANGITTLDWVSGGDGAEMINYSPVENGARIDISNIQFRDTNGEIRGIVLGNGFRTCRITDCTFRGFTNQLVIDGDYYFSKFERCNFFSSFDVAVITNNIANNAIFSTCYWDSNYKGFLANTFGTNINFVDGCIMQFNTHGWGEFSGGFLINLADSYFESNGTGEEAEGYTIKYTSNLGNGSINIENCNLTYSGGDESGSGILHLYPGSFRIKVGISNCVLGQRNGDNYIIKDYSPSDSRISLTLINNIYRRFSNDGDPASFTVLDSGNPNNDLLGYVSINDGLSNTPPNYEGAISSNNRVIVKGSYIVGGDSDPEGSALSNRGGLHIKNNSNDISESLSIRLGSTGLSSSGWSRFRPFNSTNKRGVDVNSFEDGTVSIINETSDNIPNWINTAADRAVYTTRTPSNSLRQIWIGPNGELAVRSGGSNVSGDDWHRGLTTRMISSVGSTSSRPTDFLSAGDVYFDTTLGRPVWWNGSAWIDLVNKSAASADSATPVSAVYDQVEVQAILDELRDLKTKMRAAGLLES